MLADYEQSVLCNREAIAAFEIFGIKRGLACAYVNLGGALLQLDQLDESRAASQTGLHLAEEIGNAIWQAEGLYNLGCIALAHHDHEGSIPFLERALRIFVDLGIQSQIEDVRQMIDEARQHLAAADLPDREC